MQCRRMEYNLVYVLPTKICSFSPFTFNLKYFLNATICTAVCLTKAHCPKKPINWKTLTTLKQKHSTYPSFFQVSKVKKKLIGVIRCFCVTSDECSCEF